MRASARPTCGPRGSGRRPRPAGCTTLALCAARRRARRSRFYQELLEFPLTELFENRDYPGSTHFFFDIGNGNVLAFFDFPGLDLGPYAEVLGGLHHLAISVAPEHVAAARGPARAAGVPHEGTARSSLYFRDPDGARLELISDPLGEMYGLQVL